MVRAGYAAGADAVESPVRPLGLIRLQNRADAIGMPAPHDGQQTGLTAERA